MSEKHGASKAWKRLLTVTVCVLLVLITLVVLAAVGLGMTWKLIFNGPSEAARDALARSYLASDTTAWIPSLFLDEQTMDQIQNGSEVLPPPQESRPPEVVVEFAEDNTIDPWADCPDGIRIEKVHGRTFTATVMLIRDPASVYLGTSSKTFDLSINGNRILQQMKKEGAVAAINGGAFNDDGTANSYIGSLPMGMVVSNGEILWDDGKSYEGFVGLTEDHTLVVADSMDRAAVREMKIRDGCCFGPVFIKDGKKNDAVYGMDTSFNARTAIGQRADGTIIFLCIDGRQAGSLGATYADAMELMVQLGAVNACNLDGGASTVMAYRDTYGRYGSEGEVVLCNSYALIQASARRMPTFFMVRDTEGED